MKATKSDETNQQTESLSDPVIDLGSPLIVGAVERSVTVWPEGDVHDDWIAEEIPVALSYNGISHVVMMLSPTNLKQFALGFSFTEGIIEKAKDMHDCEIKHCESQKPTAGIEINLTISQRCFSQLKKRHRQLSGKTGCGICGLESLAMLEREFDVINSEMKFSNRAIQRSVKLIESQQPLQKLTGATHGAFWCDVEGNIIFACEDVGRHNALDKLIGVLLEQATDTSNGFIFISSRVSYEMAQKAIAIGAPLLVGASAPTSMALSEADKYGLCVVGFARQGRQVIYTEQQRIIEG